MSKQSQQYTDAVVDVRKYKKVPPDGGWGYFVLVGMAICFICTLGAMPCFALVFGEFLTKLGAETSAFTLITSVFFFAYSCVGPFTKYLFEKYSVRSVGVFGAIIFSLGSVLTIFANSVFHLLITFGILQGAGFGFMISVSYSTFNSYFVEKRVMMMSLSQSLLGLGSMAYPILVQFLLITFGYRGCMAIIAGINCHCLLGMLVMHPVKWHMKLVEVKDVVNGKSNGQVKDIEKMNHEVEKLLKKPEHQQTKNIDGNSIDSKKPDKKSTWQKIVDFLDLTLLKDPVYVNIALGMSFALYSDVSFFTIQPIFLVYLNFSQAHIAQIIAIGATADLLSRIFLVISSVCIKVRARFIYLSGAILTIAARFAFLYVHEFFGMAIVTAVLGFLRTWLHVPLSLTIGDYLSPERFPSGYGLFMFVQGNIMFVFGPIAGYIRDVTQSYEIAFHCLTFAMALCAIPWLIELMWFSKNKNCKK